MGPGPRRTLQRTMREIELSRYLQIESEKVTSLEELRTTLRDNSIVETLDPRNNYKKFQNKDEKLVAYECPSCQTIITGPPKIETTERIKAPGTSRDSVRHSCQNCNHSLYEWQGLQQAIN
jgi:hypothetical protein